jgi:hypothetical protein
MTLAAWSIGELSYGEDLQSLIAGVITPGTPTATTIPVSASPSTGGYPPVNYQWAISLHGANTYSNFGTNSLFGQTATGLTASTSYDIRLAYQDDTGFTVYAFALNVSTSSGGGSTWPPPYMMGGDYSMQQFNFRIGSVNNIVRFFIRDVSVTTYTKGLTGLTAASAGLTADYYYNGSNGQQSFALVAATLDVWQSGGFVEIGEGWYQLGVPNTIVSVPSSLIMLQGAANMEPVTLQFGNG